MSDSQQLSPPNSEESSSSFDQLKKYGTVGIVTHLALSWSFLLGTYLFVNRTGKSAVLIKYLKLESKIPPKAGSLVISGIIYKAVMPFRIALTLLVLPGVIALTNQKPSQ